MNNEKKDFYTHISENFDFSGMDSNEKDNAIRNIQDLLIENSITKLIGESSELKASDFEKFLSEDRAVDDIIKYMEEKFPNFNEILFAETENLLKQKS